MRLPLASIIVCILTAGNLFCADWPMFRGDPSLTGYVKENLPENLSVLWTYEAKNPVESTAAIVEDTVYIGLSVEPAAGTKATSTSTSTSTSTNQAVSSVPPPEPTGKMIALDLDTGKLKWTYKTKAPIRSSPLVLDGKVYFGDMNGTSHCINAKTGKLIWIYKKEYAQKILASPNAIGNKVFIASYDGTLLCFNKDNGRLLWTYMAQYPFFGSPAVFGDVITISSCDGSFGFFNVENGERVGGISVGTYITSSPCIIDGKAYLATMNCVYARADMKEMKMLWYKDNPGTTNQCYSSPAGTKDIMIFGTREKLVICLNGADGSEKWKFETGDKVDGSPVIAGDFVYFGSADGKLYKLKTSNGEKAWDYTLGSEIAGSPAVARGKLVIGAMDGAVYCFGEKK